MRDNVQKRVALALFLKSCTSFQTGRYYFYEKVDKLNVVSTDSRKVT